MHSTMFVVKRLGKNGMWSAVSLIDQNGSFRGEAKFETREEDIEYLADYLDRMKTRIRISPEGYGEVKVFDNDKPLEAPGANIKKPKTKSKSRSKAYEKQKKKTRDFKLQF